MKKAIFFDIDGTLMNSLNGEPTISSAVKKSIRELQEKNNKVFIATGRPFAFLCDELLNFGFDGFVLMNGSLILDKDKLPVYKCAYDKDTVKKLVEKFEEYNIQYILQDVKYSYSRKEFKELKKMYESIGINDEYIKTDFNIDDIDVYKIEMYCDNDEGTEFCKALENDEFKYVYYEEFKLFELYSRKNSKSSGIKRVLESYGIDIKDSYAFGDGKNDIEMLNAVGCGIAMGNASDEIKSHADKVTLSVAEDGICYGIDNFIMK